MLRLVPCHLLASILLASAQAEAGIQMVALTGRRAPQTTEGELFYRFSDVQINDQGAVGFYAELADPLGQQLFVNLPGSLDQTPDVGVWIRNSAESQLMVRQGRALAAAPGNPVWLIDPRDSDDLRYGYSLSDAGVLFQGMLGAGPYDVGLWFFPTQGQAVPIAYSGQAIPGGDLVFGGLSVGRTTNRGHSLFNATLYRSENDTQVAAYSHWVFSPTEGLRLIARSGVAAPGTTPPIVFDSLFYQNAMNANGEVVIIGDVAPSPDRMSVTSASSSDPQGIWVGRSFDDLKLIAISSPTGLPFGRFGSPVVNDRGDVAFTSSHGAWLYGNGEFRLLARSGDVAPGTIPAQSFQSVGPVVLSDIGKAGIGVLILGDASVRGGFGIWEVEASELRPVAVPGMRAPTTDGSVFTGAELLAINSGGQLLFDATITNNVGEGRHGLFAQDVHGVLRAIAIAGDSLFVADGDARTVFVLRNAAINDRGQVVFQTYFTDWSVGIFVSDAVVVPEPTTFALSTCSLLLVAVVRWRRRLHL